MRIAIGLACVVVALTLSATFMHVLSMPMFLVLSQLDIRVEGEAAAWASWITFAASIMVGLISLACGIAVAIVTYRKFT